MELKKVTLTIVVRNETEANWIAREMEQSPLAQEGVYTLACGDIEDLTDEDLEVIDVDSTPDDIRAYIELKPIVDEFGKTDEEIIELYDCDDVWEFAINMGYTWIKTFNVWVDKSYLTDEHKELIDLLAELV